MLKKIILIVLCVVLPYSLLFISTVAISDIVYGTSDKGIVPVEFLDSNISPTTVSGEYQFKRDDPNGSLLVNLTIPTTQEVVSATVHFNSTDNMSVTWWLSYQNGSTQYKLVMKWVAVKGGNNYNLYNYPNTFNHEVGDSGLISPLNNGGNTPNISHVVFCLTYAENSTSSSENSSASSSSESSSCTSSDNSSAPSSSENSSCTSSENSSAPSSSENSSCASSENSSAPSSSENSSCASSDNSSAPSSSENSSCTSSENSSAPSSSENSSCASSENSSAPSSSENSSCASSENSSAPSSSENSSCTSSENSSASSCIESSLSSESSETSSKPGIPDTSDIPSVAFSLFLIGAIGLTLILINKSNKLEN